MQGAQVEVRQRVVVLLVESQVTPMPEAAAGEVENDPDMALTAGKAPPHG